MNQKKGQFFILAAIILVSLLAGIFIYTNQVFLTEYKEGVKFIKEEINEETGMVINYYVITNENKVDDFIINMSESLHDRKNSVEMIFFYRLDDEITIYNLAKDNISLVVNNSIENIETQRVLDCGSISLGGASTTECTESFTRDMKNLPTANFGSAPSTINFNWNGTTHETPWLEDKNIYFILKEKVDGDVITHES